MIATDTARPLKWTLYALALVLPLAFAVLIWQLWGLNGDYLCKIVAKAGNPPSAYCFNLLTQALNIKGWVIWLLIGTIASFILIVLVAATKTLVGIVGPGGLALNINSGGEPPASTVIKVGENAPESDKGKDDVGDSSH